MNILDAEAMIQAQKQLLNMQKHEKNEFKTPNIEDTMTHTNFSSTFFDECSSQMKRKIDKLIANTENLKHIKQNQPNSSLKIFTFMIFSLLFPTQKSEKIKGSFHINNSLLQTLKCSLYSKDINLTQQSKQNLVKENLQAKAMMARFLNILEVEFISKKYEKISLTDWMLQHNPNILKLFTIFFRNILVKLDIEDALEETIEIPFTVAISNLIEYFDISYRNFGEFLLVCEANYFLASVENELIIGQYFENGKKQGYKKNVINIDQEQSFNIESQILQKHKKHHLLQSQVKNFNFLLDSGHSSHILHQEQHDNSTPHFKQSHQLAFGKKKKDQEVIVRHELLKKQFEKLIMDSDTQSLHQNLQEGEVSTPQLGKDSQQFNFYKIKQETQDNENSQSNTQSIKTNSFLRKTTFNQVAIDELQDENVFDSKINPQQSKLSKNIVEVKDKNISTYSPQANHIFQYECFTSFNNDAIFLGRPNKNNNQYNNSSTNKQQSLFNPFLSCQCNCVPIKKMKNLVVSKVVQFNFTPIHKTNSLRSPKFLSGLKPSQNINLNHPRIKITPPKDNTTISIPQNPIQNPTREVRTPAFLKVKKQKNDKNEKNSASSNSKSKKSLKQPSQNKQSTAKLHFDKEHFHKNFNNTRYSAILTKHHNESRSKDQIIKSSRQKNQSSSLSKRIITQQGASIKNFDSRFTNNRPGLGYNWKSTSNFHQPSHQFTTKRLTNKDYQQINRREKMGETMKVYAPVHIIAPTVYFNGNYQNDNKVIFKVNDMYGERQRVMEMKDGQKFSKNQNTNTTHVYQSGPERITNRCFKKYN